MKHSLSEGGISKRHVTPIPCRDTDFGQDLHRDGNRVDQILDNPLSLLKTLLTQPLRAGDHNAVRQHDGGQLLDIVR